MLPFNDGVQYRRGECPHRACGLGRFPVGGNGDVVALLNVREDLDHQKRVHGQLSSALLQFGPELVGRDALVLCEKVDDD